MSGLDLSHTSGYYINLSLNDRSNQDDQIDHRNVSVPIREDNFLLLLFLSRNVSGVDLFTFLILVAVFIFCILFPIFVKTTTKFPPEF